MKISNFILLVAIAAAALLASLMVQRQAEAALGQNVVSLRRQQQEIDGLTEENQRLSNQVAQADHGADNANRGKDFTTELAQLRTQAAALRSQENQLSNRVWKSRISAGTRLLSAENYNLWDHNHGRGHIILAGGPREDGKVDDALAYTAALLRYAQNNQGIFPQTLDQVTSYLPQPNQKSERWDNGPVSGTNSFEIVYHGTTNDLIGIPLENVVLVRETQPWLTPDGKWARVYGLADGAARTVTSDDNFASWDALHILPTSTGP